MNIGDNCTISEDVDLGANTLLVNGTDGLLSIQANVSAKKIQFKPSVFDGSFRVGIKTGVGMLMGSI